MRPILLLLVLATQLSAAERPFDYPVASRKAEFSAVFTKTSYEESKREGTKLAIKDREGKTLFEHELDRDVARNAEWTHDSKFLVITAQNGGGHQPWHYSVYVFRWTHARFESFRSLLTRPHLSAPRCSFSRRTPLSSSLTRSSITWKPRKIPCFCDSTWLRSGRSYERSDQTM